MQHFSRRLLLQFCAAIALAIPSVAQDLDFPAEPGFGIDVPSFGTGNTGTDPVDLRLFSDFSPRDRDRFRFPPSYPTISSSGNTGIVAASGSPGPGGCAPDGECEPEHGGHPHHDDQRDNSTCSDAQHARNDCTNARKDAIVSQPTATTNDDHDSHNYDLWGGIGLLVSLFAFGLVTYLCGR